ncbi:unnamed protein product, partial [Ectocarpus sp. 8 AP-2014]
APRRAGSIVVVAADQRLNQLKSVRTCINVNRVSFETGEKDQSRRQKSIALVNDRHVAGSYEMCACVVFGLLFHFSCLWEVGSSLSVRPFSGPFPALVRTPFLHRF